MWWLSQSVAELFGDVQVAGWNSAVGYLKFFYKLKLFMQIKFQISVFL